MPLIVPNVGKIKLAELLVSEGAVLFDLVKLFRNNHTPGPLTTLADLTEANFSNYAAQALANPVVAAALDATNRAVITWDNLTFTKNGVTSNDIFGYWVVDDAGNLLWAERFSVAPIALTVDGQFIVFTPTLTGMSQFLNA